MNQGPGKAWGLRIARPSGFFCQYDVEIARFGCQYVQGWLFARALDSQATGLLLLEDGRHSRTT
jgi:hypothetical protein